MAKLSRRVTSCCVALFLALTSVSAVHEKLNSINDLKSIDFGPSVPKHSLVLLHWFANTVDIDNTDDIWLTFDPYSRDYGAHPYHNRERLLDPLPERSQYYSLGNRNQGTSMQFPSYIFHPPVREYQGGNADRIIIRVWEQNTGRRTRQRIDRVYITQHYTSEHRGTRYDPDHTYEITTDLLRQIREFSVGERQQPLLHLRNWYESNADVDDIRNTWSNLACLGLLLFIVIDEKYFNNQRNNRPENNNRRENNNGPQNNYRPETYDIPETFDDILETYNRPESTNCTALICMIFIFLIILYIYFSRK